MTVSKITLQEWEVYRGPLDTVVFEQWDWNKDENEDLRKIELQAQVKMGVLV